MISVLIESTKDTPETAASPTAETMTTSAMPTKTARICSIIKGIRRRRRSFFENNTITWIQRTHGKRSGAATSDFLPMDSMGICFSTDLAKLVEKKNITIIRAFAEICKKAARAHAIFFGAHRRQKDKNRKMVFVFHTTNACKTVEREPVRCQGFWPFCHFITIYS